MNINEVDLTPLFKRNGYRISNSILIHTNKNTYFPDSESTTGWLPGIMEIYSSNKLHEYKGKDFFIVGSGAAIEGISMCLNLNPNILYCSDINKSVLPVAKHNIEHNCNGTTTAFKYVESDLLSFLKDNKIKVDLIHENLPNLPLNNKNLVFEKSNSASFYVDTYTSTPDYIIQNRLELHYNLLKQATNFLNKNGSVISCIGCRIDFSIIEKMFTELNYKYEILAISMVEQLAAETVITGYIETQKKFGNKFHFFDYDKDKETLYKLKKEYNNPEEIISKILEVSFDANIANKKFLHNIKVSHIGLIIKAQVRN